MTLAYVTCQDTEVILSVDDPPANYVKVDDEMVSRAPHFDVQGNIEATFAADNRKGVWEILEGICHEMNVWTWIKSFNQTKNGREAYLALYNHDFGILNADNVQLAAE